MSDSCPCGSVPQRFAPATRSLRSTWMTRRGAISSSPLPRLRRPSSPSLLFPSPPRLLSAFDRWSPVLHGRSFGVLRESAEIIQSAVDGVQPVSPLTSCKYRDNVVCLDAFNKLTSLISLKIKNLNVTPFLVDHQGTWFPELGRDELHLLRYVRDSLFCCCCNPPPPFLK